MKPLILKLTTRTGNQFSNALGLTRPKDIEQFRLLNCENPTAHVRLWPFPGWVLEKLVEMRADGFLRLPNIGLKSAQEMIEELARHGIVIRGALPLQKKQQLACPHCGHKIDCIASLTSAPSAPHPSAAARNTKPKTP